VASSRAVCCGEPEPPPRCCAPAAAGNRAALRLPPLPPPWRLPDVRTPPCAAGGAACSPSRSCLSTATGAAHEPTCTNAPIGAPGARAALSSAAGSERGTSARARATAARRVPYAHALMHLMCARTAPANGSVMGTHTARMVPMITKVVEERCARICMTQPHRTRQHSPSLRLHTRPSGAPYRSREHLRRATAQAGKAPSRPVTQVETGWISSIYPHEVVEHASHGVDRRWGEVEQLKERNATT